MKVRDLMTSTPEAITPEQTIDKAAQLMKELDVGYIPVINNPHERRLLGAVTDRDLVVRHLAHGKGDLCCVEDVMTRREQADQFLTVRPNDTIEHLLHQMSARQLRRVPVVELDDQRLVGVISQADLALYYGDDYPTEVEKMVASVSQPVQPREMTVM